MDETEVLLPEGSWKNLLGDAGTFGGWTLAEDLLSCFPVAALTRNGMEVRP
jgi:hypothetical protein